jgi:hypothetical protein
MCYVVRKTKSIITSYTLKWFVSIPYFIWESPTPDS